MKKLSTIALEKCNSIILSIKEHPFNQELANGSLSIEKFGFYIEQDTLYLRDFSRSLAFIAAKAPFKFIKEFLSFSEGALIAEQEVVHSFFRHKFNLQYTGKITPATLSYTSYLLQKSIVEPVEIGIAAVLPCFWVYSIVGKAIVENTKLDFYNPYKEWIEIYSGKEFSDSVNLIINIFDVVGVAASDEIQNLMIEVFYKSTVLEWHFWNDAYNLLVFDAFIK